MTCVHFRPPEEADCCAAGVSYQRLAGGGAYGRIFRLPCVPISNRRGEQPRECARFFAAPEEEGAR